MDNFDGFRPKGSDGAQQNTSQLVNPDAGFRPSVRSVTPYVNEKVEARKGRCIANGDTCKGFRAKDTKFCIGHLRSMAKAQREEREVNESADVA